MSPDSCPPIPPLPSSAELGWRLQRQGRAPIFRSQLPARSAIAHFSLELSLLTWSPRKSCTAVLQLSPSFLPGHTQSTVRPNATRDWKGTIACRWRRHQPANSSMMCLEVQLTGRKDCKNLGGRKTPQEGRLARWKERERLELSPHSPPRSRQQ